MGKGNPISTFAEGWRRHGPSPLLTAGLLGAATYGLGYAMYEPMRKWTLSTAKSLGRPFANKMKGKNGESTVSSEEVDDGMDNLAESAEEKLGGKRRARHIIPGIAGALAAMAAAYHFADPSKKAYGLLSWDRSSGLEKSGALDAFNSSIPGGYVQELQWDKPISLYAAAPLFKSDPHLADDPYVRNMGTAILSTAAQYAGSPYPTTGNVFDAAVDKLKSKLTLGGVVGVGVKTMVSNGLARLFTGALGSMCDLDPKVRQNLVDAGTWAGAIASILT